MSFGISISECIALTELITAAYHCWSRIPKEIAAFLSLVQDLKTQAKGLEANRLFETQILLPSERESLGDWISTTWNILKSFQQIEQHARADGQLVQRLRWLFNRKLKSLAEQISRQTDALKDFKQDLVVRAVTVHAFENQARFAMHEIACSADQLRQLEESKEVPGRRL